RVSKMSESEQQLKEQVQQQSVMSSVQNMLSKVSGNCFRKCVDYPKGSLLGSEQRCLNLCMDRYLDSYNLVAKTFFRRLERE
ncbi:hypothetical protein KR009_002635, partial [Drosophila setifemur]